MSIRNMALIESRQEESRHSPFPYSLDPITPVFKDGLIPVSIFAMMSLLSVTSLLGFITYRLIRSRKYYRSYVGYNQYIVLIYNLLLADLQQSIAFSISFHWLKLGKILAPTPPCFIQAWFLNIGDVASGFFVLAIAIHTWLGVVKGYKLPHIWFVVSILVIWLAALVLTCLGPAIYQERFFARAGGWCWISTDFQRERLWYHYFWIFLSEFGVVAIYCHVFFHLRSRIQGIIRNENTSKLTRATKFMVLYPFVYVVLTLPIAVGRMVAMTGQPMPDEFFIFAGSLLTSCGWIDVLLYTLTRRVLVNSELSTGQYNHDVTAVTTNAARPGDAQDYGLSSMTGKEPLSTATRTVQIVGGSSRLSRMVDSHRGRSAARSKTHNTIQENSPTRTGSQDSIIKPMALSDGINIVTETNIQVESAPSTDDLDTTIPRTRDWSEANSRRS